MPRAATFPPYPRRPHSGSGQARIKLGGRHLYLGVFGSLASHERYNQLLAQWLAAQQTGQPTLAPAALPRDLTVRDIAARFLAWAELNLSARGGELKQFRAACRPLLELFGSELATAFRARQLKALLATLPGRGWSGPTCNRHLGRLKFLWRWAEEQGLVPEGSAAHLAIVKGLKKGAPGVRGRQKRRLPSEEEVWLVADRMPPAAGAILRLLWLTGMRTTEALILRPVDVDRSSEVWAYRPSFHKLDHAGQERLVLLAGRSQEVLTPWLAGRLPEDWAFAGKGGRRWNTITFGRLLSRACRKAGVQRFAAYSLRHCSKMRFERAVGLKQTGELLGQKCLSTTQSYGQFDLESATEAARKIG